VPTPQPARKIGLALSGGGFRATLYHLGLVRFLRDAGILRDITHITSVSGGSIIGAHLALHWDRYNGSDSDFDAAAAELLAFIRLGVRNRIVRRFPLGFALRGPRRLVGLSNRKLTRTGLLEYHYQRYLYGDKSLFELPERPQIHILATNVSEGRISSFNREGLWMIRREASHGFRIEKVPTSLATVPMAVAASSAFPGFFPPIPLSAQDVGASGAFARQSYTDGGVYDNLGVRMFHFLARSTGEEEHPWDSVLVSDVGKPFRVESEAPAGGLVRTAMRASEILMDRVWQLESETFGDSAEFVFARITDIVDPKDDPTALHPEIQRQLPGVRTDLDRFSRLEIASLVRHGYCVGRNACRRLPQVFGTQLPDNAPWVPAFGSAPATPGPAPSERDAGQATKEARRLHASGVRRIWSRLFDLRDWTSYVYVPILVPIVVLAPYFSVKYYERSQRISQIVESLAQGSRDVEQMARLLEGPVVPFEGERAQELPALAPGAPPGPAGFVILQDLRMIDLRRWRPVANGGADSYLYGYRRLKVRRDPENVSKHEFRASVLATVSDLQIRFPAQELKPVLYSRASSSASGEAVVDWEVAADFRGVPPDEAAEIIYEHISPGKFVREGFGSATLAFEVEGETAELTRWLLMPRGRTYRSFRLIRYRTGKPELPEAVNVVTRYLAEDRSILAFKLLALEPDYTYELTWFYQ
jgi:predicted acylesterase/phospholipase RssA